MRKNKGFSLIELMIVVAIIGILSMIAVPAYQDYVRKTQVAEALFSTGGIRNSLLDFYAVEGTLTQDEFTERLSTHNEAGMTISVEGKRAIYLGYPHLIKVELELADSYAILDQDAPFFPPGTTHEEIQSVIDYFFNTVQGKETKSAGTMTYYFDDKFNSYSTDKPEIQMQLMITNGSLSFMCNKSTFKSKEGVKLLNRRCAMQIGATGGWGD